MSTVMAPVQDNGVATLNEVTPIIIDLGKKKRKRIKDLKRGRGKLMTEVANVMAEARMSLGNDADGKELIPVVLIYRQKRRRKGRGLALPIPFLSG